MNSLLAQANYIIKKDRPLDNPEKIISTFRRGNFLQLTFQTVGCQYSSAGSCTMCNYGIGKKFNHQEILNELEAICFSKDFLECNMVLLGASGSFLDDYEIPEILQNKILKCIGESHMREVFIETHFKSITEAKLRNIKKYLPNICVNIEMGLETTNPKYQQDILNKEIPLSELKEKIEQIHDFGMIISLNVLLGMPFLTAKMQISDTLESIRWALDNGVDYIVVFPINIQPYTLFEWWYINGYLSAPSLWILVELLLRLSDEELRHICMAWYGNRQIIYPLNRKTITPHSCPICQPHLISLFEDISNNFDLKYRKERLRQFSGEIFPCKCRNKFGENMQNDTEELFNQKLKESYNKIESWVVKCR